MSSTRTFCSVVTGLLALCVMIQAQETRGTPGVDYPNYDEIPKTSFSCSEQKYTPGLYGDMEARCQVFHFCDENLQESFLCPPGMTFNQASLACDSWDNSNCSLTPQFYSMNSGPEMENARRNILMVLQIRNKSRSRPSIRPSADVYEKITSLYDSDIGEDRSKSPDTAAVDVNPESNDEISYEGGSQGTHEEANEESEDSGSRFTQDLSGLDDSILNEFTDISESVGSEIFYDPVTEKYYVDYDSSQTANEVSEDSVDPFNRFYNYGDFVKRYGISYNGYGDETQSNSNENDLEFNEILAAAEGSEKELSKRTLDAERPPRRVRRRPLYAVVQDGDEFSISGVDRGVAYPMVDSDVNESEVSYEVSQEFQNPDIASVDNSEESQASEFEQVILSELVSPQIGEHGFRRSLFPEEEQSEEPMQSDSHAYKTADEYSYVENVTPDDYESYSTDYTEVDAEIVGEPQSEQEMSDNEESSNWYRNEESLDSDDTAESDDTYVVIPDEYDSALEQYSETNRVAETYDAQSDSADSYDAWMDFLPSYVSPAAYTPVGPYWLSVPPYYPNEYGRPAPFTSEDLVNPEFLKSPEYVASGIPNDQEYGYDFAETSERYVPRPYAYESGGFPGHVYDYGTEYGYPYAHVYGHPYTGQFGYDASEERVAAESSNLNENHDFAITGNSDYSESDLQSWAQAYSTESSEGEEGEMEVTESSVQTEEAFADLYGRSRSDGDSDVLPSEISDEPSDEEASQVETFYLFDFDEDNKEEFEPHYADAGSDADQLGSNGSFQAEEPSPRNESFESDLEGANVGSEPESTASGSEDFDKQNSRPLPRSETAAESRHNEDPVSLSASGNSAAPNTPTTQSPRQPRSYDGNINLSTLNRIYPESNFRLQDTVMARSYSDDVSLESDVEDEFFHRTGNVGQSRVPKLSEIQKRILSLKQGKLGTLKKYMNSAGSKN